MSQLNIHLTPAFEEKLRRFMRARGIKSKSEAVRIAVEEGLEREIPQRVDFREWVGMARGDALARAENDSLLTLDSDFRVVDVPCVMPAQAG